VKRKGFLNAFCLAAVALVLAFFSFKKDKTARKHPYTYEEKEALIALALKTPEGRKALSQAMLTPVNHTWAYGDPPYNWVQEPKRDKDGKTVYRKMLHGKLIKIERYA